MKNAQANALVQNGYQCIINLLKQYTPKVYSALKNNTMALALQQLVFPLVTTLRYDAARLRLQEYAQAPRDGRLVFYTAIFGEYSRLLPPTRLMPRARYVCFSDMPKPTYGIWEIRPLPQAAEMPDGSPRWASRWCKLHPHILFPEAEVAVWLDANIVINDDLELDIRHDMGGIQPVGMIRHPERNCVYKEIAACRLLGKDCEERLERQRKRYESLGVPARGGLFETGVIINRLRHPRLAELYDAWWQELAAHGWRDQISLAYVLDKLKILPCEFLAPGVSAKNSGEFIYLKHDATFRAALDDGALLSSRVAFPEPVVSYAAHVREHPGCVEAAATSAAAVVVPVHNALADVQACLASVLPTLRAQDRLIVVNDASDAETTGWLRRFARTDERITLLENTKNLGYTGSANRGLQATDAPFRVMLNSDTVVCAGWLEKLLLVAFSDDKTGIVGPLSNAATYQSVPSLRAQEGNTPINPLPPGKTVCHMDRLCEETAPWGLYPAVPLIHGFCFGIREEVIKKIGYFDEVNFGRFFGEENDYCLRAAEAGFLLRVATMAYVYHAKSKSITAEMRGSYVHAANRRLQKIHGPKKIKNAISQTKNSPLLLYMREKVQDFYDTFN